MFSYKDHHQPALRHTQIKFQLKQHVCDFPAIELQEKLKKISQERETKSGMHQKPKTIIWVSKICGFLN